MTSIKLTVKFTKQTWSSLNQIEPAVPWEDVLEYALKDHDFECYDDTPMTVGQMAAYIEQRVIGLWDDRISKFVGSKDQLDMQCYRIWRKSDNKELRYQAPISEYLNPGDTVIAEAQAMKLRREPREFTEEEIAKFRKTLRFDLNDRVLCFCGPRWLSGHIVGTGVPEEDDLLPYLVKTDALPGLPTNSISAPCDEDDTIMQEVCFDPSTQLHLVKAATPVAYESSKPKLRFAVGDKVVCRIRNDPKDGLERWVPGAISSIWPNLPRPDEMWDMGGVSGKFPALVPYKIDLASGGWIYCHRDDHTLIRRPGMEPATRVKGISKRMEVRKLGDGGQEKIDHVTERRKRIMIESSDSE